MQLAPLAVLLQSETFPFKRDKFDAVQGLAEHEGAPDQNPIVHVYTASGPDGEKPGLQVGVQLPPLGVFRHDVTPLVTAGGADLQGFAAQNGFPLQLPKKQEKFPVAK